jgi:hypothetical protein
MEKKALLVIGVENMANLPYSSVSSFFWINVEQQNEHIM